MNKIKEIFNSISGRYLNESQYLTKNSEYDSIIIKRAEDLTGFKFGPDDATFCYYNVCMSGKIYEFYNFPSYCKMEDRPFYIFYNYDELFHNEESYHAQYNYIFGYREFDSEKEFEEQMLMDKLRYE